MKSRTLENRFLSLRVDAAGRVVSLKNRLTGAELITHAQAAEAWRIIVPTGRHTVDFVLGSRQLRPSIKLHHDGDAHSLVITYDRLEGARSWGVRARFVFTLGEEAREITAHAEVENKSDATLDEVEFPVLGGLGGFPGRGGRRTLDLVAAGDRGDSYPDVLVRGLPETGRESHHFVREHETAMFECDSAGVWLDLWCERQGLFIGRCSPQRDFAFKIEKFPKEVPNRPAHFYPKETPRWLRVSALHVPRLAPGASWRSDPIVIMPHEGDWHAGADRYAAYRRKHLTLAAPPAWMDSFVGWTEILGNTYLGEVFHDYDRCATAVVADKRVTGLDLVFLYGHTKLGAEGADVDCSPAPDLGGEDGFRAMVEKLHASGIRIMLLDHLHGWVNRELPEYAALGLDEDAVLGLDGRPLAPRWWKETFLSCRRLEGPTPVWAEICPSSRKWRDVYLEHLTRMIRLGIDGLELDCFEPSRCHSASHSHAPGADVFLHKLEFMRAVRSHAKRLNPGFVLIGETMRPEAREVLDGFYSSRFLTEQERIYRYLFPEIREQTVLVGNYAYDQVNKALALGVGVNTEIWGLRKTALDGCPELARYIGDVNRLRRKHARILIHGIFRDTLGARVKGDCLYSVLEDPDGDTALVLRNPHAHAVAVEAALGTARCARFSLWRPFAGERRVARLPVRVRLRPYEAAVLLALNTPAGQ